MKFTEFHRTIQIRIGLAFATNTVSNMALPFMPIYFANRLGTTLAGVAAILSIAVGMVSGMVGGYYADRIGRKKLVLAAEAVWAVSCLVMALANSAWWTSPGVTLAMMLLVSLCWGVHRPAIDGMMLDVTKPEERKYMYGFMYWANNLSSALAGVVGAYLFKEHLFGLLLAQMAVVLVSFCIVLSFIQESNLPLLQSEPMGEKSARGNIWTNYKQVLQDRMFIIYIIASMLVVSVEFHMGNYISVRLEENVHHAALWNWSSWSYRVDGIQLVGMLRSENTILIVILSFLIRSFMKRFADKPLLFGGFLLYTMGYGYLAYSDRPWMLLLSMLIATFGELLYVPIKQAYLGYIVPDHARSSYMALNNMSFSGAMLISGGGIILGGWLPAWGMAVMIFVTGIVGVGLFTVILPKMDAKRNVAMRVSSGTAASGTISVQG